MQIAGYPRAGTRLAPRTLRPVLGAPAGNSEPWLNVKLSDLQEDSWSKYGPFLCKQLADRIVREVAKQFRFLPADIHGRTLDSITNGRSIDLAEVSARTYNCLVRLKGPNGRQALGELRISDLVRARGFGARCLVDLLSALETIATLPQTKNKNPDSITSEQLTIAAQKLMKNQLVESIKCDDPRVGPHLASLRTSVQSLGYLTWPDTTAWELAERLVFRRADPVNIPAMIEEISRLDIYISGLASQSLENELADVVSSLTTTPRNKVIVAKYFGLDGKGARTLQRVGDEYGLTRERVRQICDKAMARCFRASPFVPKLQMALSCIKECTGSTERRVQRRLIAAGLTERAFRLSGLFRAAELFRIETPVTLDEFQSALLKGRSGWEIKRRIVQIARKTVSFWGVTTSTFVQDKVLEKSDHEVPVDIVIESLSAERDCVWLEKEAGWFWLRDVPTNSLVKRIRKVLAVCEHLDISELRLAVSRDPRTHGFSPPKRVLLALCANLPFCKVQANEVVRTVNLDVGKILADSEYSIYSVLSKKGPLVRSSDLDSACLKNAMNRHTIMALKTHSPIIARYAPCIYGLRGVVFPPGLLSDMIAMTPLANRVTEDYGCSRDGRPWIAYKVTHAMLSAGVLHIPAAMTRYIAGRFAYVWPGDDSEAHAIVVEGARAWGAGPFLRRQAVEMGDTVIVIFDIKSGSAEMHVGDSEIVEEIQSHMPSGLTVPPNDVFGANPVRDDRC
jgi:hypothetical protein